jgi:hypothetical protein
MFAAYYVLHIHHFISCIVSTDISQKTAMPVKNKKLLKRKRKFQELPQTRLPGRKKLVALKLLYLRVHTL